MGVRTWIEGVAGRTGRPPATDPLGPRRGGQERGQRSG